MAGGGEEVGELVCGPYLGAGSRSRGRAWWVGVERDVVVDESTLGGLPEGGADGDVDVVDGLGAETSSTGTAVVDQVAVEAIEMLATKRAEGDVADGRDDVVVDDPPVPGGGPGTQLTDAAGHPLFDQEGAQGHLRAGLVPCREMFGGEPSCDGFGVEP